MQRNAVPLGVEHDRPEAVRTNGMLGHKNLPTICRNRGNGIIQPSLAVQVQERSMIRRFVLLGAMKASGDDLVSSWQKADRHPRVFLLRDRSTQYCGIEPDGSIQVEHGDIHPYNLIHHDDLRKGQGAKSMRSK
jgi:hypothetical protein